MLNEEKKHIAVLKPAIDEGIQSGRAEDFNPAEYLKHLKSVRNQDIR